MVVASNVPSPPPKPENAPPPLFQQQANIPLTASRMTVFEQQPFGRQGASPAPAAVIYPLGSSRSMKLQQQQQQQQQLAQAVPPPPPLDARSYSSGPQQNSQQQGVGGGQGGGVAHQGHNSSGGSSRPMPAILSMPPSIAAMSPMHRQSTLQRFDQMTVLYQQQMQLFPTNNQQQPSAPTPQRQQQPSNECDFDDFEGKEDEGFQQQQQQQQQPIHVQHMQHMQHGVVQTAPSPSPSLSRSTRPQQAQVAAQRASPQTFPQQPLQNTAQYSSSDGGTPIKISTSIRPIGNAGSLQPFVPGGGAQEMMQAFHHQQVQHIQQHQRQHKGMPLQQVGTPVKVQQQGGMVAAVTPQAVMNRGPEDDNVVSVTSIEKHQTRVQKGYGQSCGADEDTRKARLSRLMQSFNDFENDLLRSYEIVSRATHEPSPPSLVKTGASPEAKRLTDLLHRIDTGQILMQDGGDAQAAVSDEPAPEGGEKHVAKGRPEDACEAVWKYMTPVASGKSQQVVSEILSKLGNSGGGCDDPFALSPSEGYNVRGHGVVTP